MESSAISAVLLSWQHRLHSQMPAEGLREGAAVSCVPVVDSSADPQAVGTELDEICRMAGFFPVTGHGVRGGVAERAWTTATRFFDLPPAAS
jgi:hypothetical protein